jgi:Dolichyl-phosphate-mannose-protein mannosyltransferase
VSAARTVLSDPAEGPAAVPDVSRRHHLLLLALLLAGSLPFWGKAFHVDDTFFIAVAESLRLHPLRPLAGSVALDDTDQRVFARLGTAPNTFETLSHPPLVPYLIAGVSALTGGLREIPEHAAFFVFPVAAAWFQYRLARRFTSTPLAAAIFLVSCPIFVLSGQSLMTDMPALALSLAGLALFVEGADSGDVRRLLLSGLVIGLAILTRYVCLGLVPLGILYAWGWARRPTKTWMALLPLVGVLGLWCAQNWLEHGALHLAASLRHYGQYYQGRYVALSDLGRRAMSDVAALGGTALPLVVWIALARNPARGGIWLGHATVVAGMVVWLDPFHVTELRSYGAGAKAALTLCLAAGLFLLGDAVRRARPWRSDRGFLLLWMMGALLGTIALLPFGSARYMLPVLPPLFLLLCAPERAGERAAYWSRHEGGTRLAAALTLFLGLLLGVADHEYAGVYRAFAEKGTHAVAGDHRVFFIGDWGFRYYMERGGNRYLLSTDESPTEGDFVVRPRIAALHDIAPRLRARVQHEATIAMNGILPLRLMSYEARAGYYSHGWGLLPFAFSDAPLELFDVFRVVAPPS